MLKHTETSHWGSSSDGKLLWRAVLDKHVTYAITPPASRVFETEDECLGRLKPPNLSYLQLAMLFHGAVVCQLSQFCLSLYCWAFWTVSNRSDPPRQHRGTVSLAVSMVRRQTLAFPAPSRRTSPLFHSLTTIVLHPLPLCAPLSAGFKRRLCRASGCDGKSPSSPTPLAPLFTFHK